MGLLKSGPYSSMSPRSEPSRIQLRNAYVASTGRLRPRSPGSLQNQSGLESFLFPILFTTLPTFPAPIGHIFAAWPVPMLTAPPVTDTRNTVRREGGGRGENPRQACSTTSSSLFLFKWNLDLSRNHIRDLQSFLLSFISWISTLFRF